MVYILKSVLNSIHSTKNKSIAKIVIIIFPIDLQMISPIGT